MQTSASQRLSNLKVSKITHLQGFTIIIFILSNIYFNLKGIVNFILYSLLLFYMDTLKQGVNLLNYIFDRKRLQIKVNQNFDIIPDEDFDVNEERIRISNSPNLVKIH